MINFFAEINKYNSTIFTSMCSSLPIFFFFFGFIKNVNLRVFAFNANDVGRYLKIINEQNM